MTTDPENIAGIAAIADRFDLFILDQFGVLHDGTAPYAGVLDCLTELKHRGKQIVILSNSGKRSAENEKRLEILGFANRPWDKFLSSGEVAWQQLASSSMSQNCFLISRDNDRSAVDGLDVKLVNAPQSADVILLTASEGDRFELLHYENLLSRAAERRIPCLCTNPDRIMLTSSGQKFGAGRIAELYASMGGPVTFVGKPYPAIYQAALSVIGDPGKSRVVCIGDSVEHDIAGAASAGLKSALVRTGIHAGASGDELKNEFEHQKAWPDFIVPGLIW